MNPVFEAVRSGELDRALAMAESAVRDKPSCALTRSLLADVLMIRGELERAEAHLTAVLRFDPGQEREVQSTIQLLRAESDRQQVFEEGRSPGFVVPPTESMKLRLGSMAHRRAGDAGRADELLLAAAEAEPEYRATVDSGISIGVGTHAGPPAAMPLVDWDSRFGAMLEGHSASGKYYWIPFSSIVAIEFAPVRTLRDLAWRSAVVTLGEAAAGHDEGIGGTTAFLFVPTRYPGSERHGDGLIRAGIATEWSEPAPGVGIGVGQRTFLHGDDSIAAVNIVHVRAEAGGAAVDSSGRDATDGVRVGAVGLAGRRFEGLKPQEKSRE